MPVFGSTTRISSPGTGLPSKGEPARAVVVGVDGLGDALALEHAPVDGVAHACPRIGARERAGDRDLGHAERGEHGAGTEAVRRRCGDERLDRVGVDGLGAVERDPQRREVEAAHPLERARREHPREVRPAVAVPP